MNFDLSPEQDMLPRTVREFAEREIAARILELDEREEFSCDLTRAMGDLGLFGMTVSPEYGGHSLDYLSYITAVEERARVNGSQAATVAAENSLGIGPLYYYGSEEQKRRYLMIRWTALNSGTSAVRSSSSKALSTVAGTTPAFIIFSHPTTYSSRRRDDVASCATWT